VLSANGTVYSGSRPEGTVQRAYVNVCNLLPYRDGRACATAIERELLRSWLLAVHGGWQREGEVRSFIASHLEDLTPLLGRLARDRRDSAGSPFLIASASLPSAITLQSQLSRVSPLNCHP
jgi:hypothetical protein